MKKQLISIFLAIVLSIQLLPLAQISAAMYQSQQMTEELPHSNDTAPSPSFTEEIHKHFVHVSHDELIHLSELRIEERIHHTETIYSRLSDDVQTRPPNC